MIQNQPSLRRPSYLSLSLCMIVSFISHLMDHEEPHRDLPSGRHRIFNRCPMLLGRHNLFKTFAY